jgi:hypothetical protein
LAIGNGRLEAQARAAAPGSCLDLPAPRCEQRLVGSDDRLAGGQRALDYLAGRRLTADQLDDDVDVRALNDGGQVVGPLDRFGQLDRPRSGGVAHADHDQLGRWHAVALDLASPAIVE